MRMSVKRVELMASYTTKLVSCMMATERERESERGKGEFEGEKKNTIQSEKKKRKTE